MVHIYVYIYIYTSLSLSLYIYIYTHIIDVPLKLPGECYYASACTREMQYDCLCYLI